MTSDALRRLHDACCSSDRRATDPLGERDAEAIAFAFDALSDPVRLRIFSIIAGSGEICACDLVGPMQRSQPTISHHTARLAQAGLIVGERRGRWIWWRVSTAALGALSDLLAALGEVGREPSPR